MFRTIISAAVVCAVVGLSSAPQAQTSQDIVGTWKLASIAVPEGRQNAFGDSPTGMAVFSDGGRFALVFSRADLPKIASGSTATATPEESKAILNGTTALFGSYSVEDGGKVLVMRPEGGTFPNWVGDVQRRDLALKGNELTYTTSGSRGSSAVVTLRRE